MKVVSRVLCAMMLTSVLGLCDVNQPALATIVGYTFDANLQTGVLAGTSFSGSLSYDDTEATGVGKEFLELASLDFTLLGVSFTRADIKQGGQPSWRTVSCPTLQRRSFRHRPTMPRFQTSHSGSADRE